MNFKRVIGLVVGILVLISAVSAQCDIEMSLVNQDPYPAVPGETLDLVFQITGIQTTECGKVSVVMNENFPFSVAQSNSNLRSIESGTFLKNFENFWMIPYTIVVDKDAPNGNNKVQFVLSTKEGNSQILKEFNIEVKDVKAKFEVFVRNYDKSDETITFEVINIGKNNADSLVFEIPEQDSIQVRGSNKQTIGILDSNEDTSVRFGILPNGKEEEIKILLRYNDLTNNRREFSKEIPFNPSSFKSLDKKEGWSFSTYLLIIVLVLIIVNWFYKRHKKKKGERR
jgi:hypothetical protein